MKTRIFSILLGCAIIALSFAWFSIEIKSLKIEMSRNYEKLSKELWEAKQDISNQIIYSFELYGSD